MATSRASSSSHGKSKGKSNKREKPDPNAEQQLGSKKRKFGEEIDAIFQTLGKSAKENKRQGSAEEEPKCETGGKKRRKATTSKKKRKDGEGNVERRKTRKRTGDGIAIYSEEELGINNSKAGGPPVLFRRPDNTPCP